MLLAIEHKKIMVLSTWKHLYETIVLDNPLTLNNSTFHLPKIV
jgi:hypothetical protein